MRSCRNDTSLEVWRPKDVLVVCGRSNKPEVEVNLETCEADSVPVLKRYGGGGTVVLHPHCVVVSLGAWVKDYYENEFYFDRLNQAVIDSLSVLDAKFSGLSQDGISDIVYGEKKVAGTSLFRSRHYLLYQASLLVEARVELMNRYLRHPSKEPEYRGGRTHGEFVCGLSDITPIGSVDDVVGQLESSYLSSLSDHLSDHLIVSQKAETSHLLKKISN